ncbi:MAG: signal transduction histidine kinase [Caulobacteraceae bacterium]|nr:signal transduction histidine kinase [Caulobacteraceae bacterium]
MNLTPRNLFLLLGVAFALIVIGFRVQLLWLEREHLLEQRQTQAAALARFGAAYSARIYDASARMAEEIAGYIKANDPSPEALSEYLSGRTANTTANAYAVVLDATGKVVAASEGVPTNRDFGGPGYVDQVKDANRRVETVRRSQLTGAIIYPLSQRLVDKAGRFAGVLGVNARPGSIRSTAERRPEDPQLTIWTLDGRFVAAAFVDFGKDGQAIAPAPPAGLGLPSAPAKPDPNLIAAKLPIDGWPLVAVASYDKQGVLGIWRRHVWENVALIAGLLIGVAVLVWLGVRTADREEVAKKENLRAQQVAEGALRDRELLLKEIHHRIKNSLLLTSSLIYLQARQFKDPAVRRAFEATQRRLSSIGLVHDALYSGDDLGEVDLSVYLNKLLYEAAAAYGADARHVTMTIDVEAVPLVPDQVTPVGLILTEVLTNAFKYAFREGEDGTLSVCGRVVGDEVEITVEDNGPGYEAVEGGAGLGAKLIQSLTEQIGGTFAIETNGGSVFRLRFPKVPQLIRAVPEMV